MQPARRRNVAQHQAGGTPPGSQQKLGRLTHFAVSGGVCICLAAVSPLALAQAAPKRLSDWLLEQPYMPNAYFLGLSWRVADEVPTQYALRQELLQALVAASRATAHAQAADRMRKWVATLPVTGRVPVSNADARWLQANPVRDPILLAGHSVVLPRRPATVTVIAGNATHCAVTHVSGVEARAYLEACGITKADWAWIAQPDGRMQRFGVATWNREIQNDPAPGAWIWAPSRDSGWPELFSQQLIAFLATQGPAEDPVVAPQRNSKRATKTQHAKSNPGGASQGYRYPTAESASVAANDTSGRQDSTQTVASISPSTPASRSRNAEVSSSSWGNVGLIETPTARMYEAGHFSFSYNRAVPYTRGNVFFQPLDWFEVGFRYTDINNRLYGDVAFSGTQTYKDKGVDLKFRLWPESAYVPQLAVGLRDAAGTGLFSAEYLVASKRTDMFDWSLGLGWGYLAGQTRNAAAVGAGGNFSVKNYFRGAAKPFGGVQYQTPWEKVALKLEYDSNNYQNEPLGNNQKRNSPWNFGVIFKAAKSIDISLGVERGNTVMLGLALHTQLDGLSTPKLNDPPRVPVVEARPIQPRLDWAATVQAIRTQTNWNVTSIESGARELRLTLENAGATYWHERIDKLAAVLHRDAPQSVDRFVLKYRARGNDIAEHVIDRDAWIWPQAQPLPPREQQVAVTSRAPSKSEEPANVLHNSPRPKFTHGLRVGYGQTLGGPDAFVLFQVYAQETARLWLRDDTWIDGSLRLRLVDNYSKFKQGGDNGSLPRVRTFLQQYFTAPGVKVPNLQITHVGKLSGNQYYSVYGGYLEEMFAGIGGEWLYRPFASRLALGIDVNEVKQRDFRQDLSFGNAGTQTGYRTTTGHATLYWDTGWNDVHASLAVGRYLAGDTGATVLLARTFKNGVSMGAFATKTNVTAAQFGEGSFDKGIFLNIPFDAMVSRTTGTIANFLWKPLTRDGGAFLSRSSSLYGVTGARDSRILQFKPAPVPNETLIPADYRESWTPKTTGPEPYTRITQKPPATQFEPGTSHEYRMVEALYRQGYRNIMVNYDQSNRLTIALSNDTISPVSRAVGRAARTVLPLAPLEAREIKITYAARTDPLVTYEFIDLERLGRYFAGTAGAAELANYVTVDYLNPAARQDDPLERLNDLDPEAKPKILSTVIPETVSVSRVATDFANAGRKAMDMNWAQAGALGAGAILASSALDKRAFQFAKDHQTNRWVTNGTKVGNALPWVGLAGAALLALDGSDPKRSRTGFAAAEAGMSALLLTTGLKFAVGRARPEDGLGNHSFQSFSSGNNNSAFPSRHSALAWAVATPFALEYDAPWLYGVAALTNMARVGSREHWVSDTVAGSLIGYGLGRIFWESSKSNGKNDPRISVSPGGINVAWKLD